jgi:hypothetical protein
MEIEHCRSVAERMDEKEGIAPLISYLFRLLIFPFLALRPLPGLTSCCRSWKVGLSNTPADSVSLASLAHFKAHFKAHHSPPPHSLISFYKVVPK